LAILRRGAALVSVIFAIGNGWHALEDFNAGCDIGSKAQIADLERLLYDNICGTIGGLPERKLAGHLDGLAHWREEQGVKVYKSVERPCVAFAALRQDGHAVLLVLGFCLATPPDDDTWWQQTIGPRLTESLS
jgi:hypothetical protein